MKNLNIDKNWTLFLDRDGVVNNKLEGDYVKKWKEFIFSYKALESISKLSEVFKRIIIVTNQRGIGKGLMTEKDLVLIHNKMTKKIIDNKGLIAKIYFCSDVSNSSKFRKPNPGMALNAKLDFPEINFKKSLMVGDSISDMIFGEKLGMTCTFITNKVNLAFKANEIDKFQFKSLHCFTEKIISYYGK